MLGLCTQVVVTARGSVNHSLTLVVNVVLQDFALTTPGKCPEQVDSLARNTLQLLRRRPEPDVAVAVLTEAGLLRLHEPIALRRIGRNTEVEFQPRLEQAAQVSSAPVTSWMMAVYC